MNGVRCGVGEEANGMTKMEDSLRGDDLQKLSSTGFIVGALLITIGNIWVTLVGLGNPEEALSRFGENVYFLQTIALLITFGWWAVLIGVAGVSHSITASGAI